MFRKIASAAMAGSLALSGLIGPIPVAFGATPAAPWDPFFAAPSPVADFAAGTRPLGVAAGDFDNDGIADVVEGRVSGGAAAFTFQKGNGDGTFQTPSLNFGWRVQVHNQWTITAGDINGDNQLDLVWGSTATGASTGCTISPIPTGQTCATAGGQTLTVNPGDLRVLYGNGDGTFQENPYFVSGVRFAAGQLLGRIGVTGAGSLAIANIDGDLDQDVVAGGIDGSNSVIKILRNDGGTFAMSTLISQATATSPGSPIYLPSISAQNSPWGLAFGDADGDGDLDLWIGDRALYVYLYTNNGAGSFTLTPGSTVVSATRPNVYLAHESYRAAVGFTPALASGDFNGDGKADLVLGLQSGGQLPTSGTAHDGEIVLDISDGSAHKLFGTLADIGTMARGLRVIDANGDGSSDVIAGEYDGKVRLLRQLPPLDSDGDGVSDYVDNAPNVANAGRIDMNTDGAVTYLDQLDADFDTILGNPEDASTWTRLGDPVDPDDDNDGVPDGTDNCLFVANAGQENADGDALGDACDPLDGRDADSDGVPTGPLAGDPLYVLSQVAAEKWSTGTTHFVIRIDALGRFFQNEFTQILADSATLSPADWQAKCGEDYQPEVEASDPPDPCGNPVTLPGGKELPVSLVVIPKQLWSDGPVVDWINDRNDSARLEIGQHGTYHGNNTPLGDWAGLTDRNFYSCDACGLTKAESLELWRVGYDTLTGRYDDPWVKQSGATASSKKIDWSASANPLISFAAPYNTSDADARWALAQLGFKAFSASVYEEQNPIFTPEGSHHERFDQFGIFHVSADAEVDPPVIAPDDTYDHAAYADLLAAHTQPGGLNTWLIEEVEWAGRECQYQARLTNCNGHDNRESNTVFAPRWEAWMQLLDFVKDYPGGVAMTMGDVALAQAFDNAPTVSNPDQADGDHDGIGDVIDGAALDLANASLVRNESGALTATLTNGAGDPIAGQAVTFTFNADGDGTDETYSATTDASGIATAQVTPTRPVGTGLGVSAAWDGVRTTAGDTATADVTDTSTLTLDTANPTNALVGDTVDVSAHLTDSSVVGLEGRTVEFAIGSDTDNATTDADGKATASITLSEPSGSRMLEASWAGDSGHAADSNTASFRVLKRGTNLLFTDTPTSGDLTDNVTVAATLVDTVAGALAGESVTFTLGAQVATASTDASGRTEATFAIAGPVGVQTLSASFAGDGTYEPASDSLLFTVSKETATLTMPDAVATKKGGSAKTTATLRDSDDGVLAGKTIRFYALSRGQYKLYNTVTTDTNGNAVWFVPAAVVGTVTSPTPIRAVFAGDGTYAPVTTNALAYRR